MHFIHIIIMIFGHVNARKNYSHMLNVIFPLISSKIGRIRKNTLIILILGQIRHQQFSCMNIMFDKKLIVSYKNARIHPNVTVQYLKSISFI